MGCGSSAAILPEHAITYDNELPGDRDTKHVKSSDSYDSGVGYELGSKESTGVDDDLLPDIRHLQGPTFADRRPLPPHPFEATFTERFPAVRPPTEYQNDVERLAQPTDSAAEFLVSGKPLRPLRGAPNRVSSQKKGEIVGAVNQARRVNSGPQDSISNQNLGRGDSMLWDAHRSIDHDTQMQARPPSRGGLAFDLVFGEQQELQDRVERLKKRQKHKAPKIQKKHSKTQVQKKLLEAELRRQQQTLETITKLSDQHSTVDEVGQRTNKMEEIRRAEMKRAQNTAMDKAMAARKQHLEEMRDRIRAKNEKIRTANVAGKFDASRPGTADRYSSNENKLPNLLGF